LLVAPYPILDRNIARGNASPRKIVRAEPGGELAGRGD